MKDYVLSLNQIEEFISYKTAVLAKEKGFNYIQTFGTESSLYNEEKEQIFYANYGRYGSGYDKNYISAPTQSFLQKYLRDIYNIDIIIYRSFSMFNSYHYEIIKDWNFDNSLVQCCEPDRSYEKCLEDALQSALQLIN